MAYFRASCKSSFEITQFTIRLRFNSCMQIAHLKYIFPSIYIISENNCDQSVGKLTWTLKDLHYMFNYISTVHCECIKLCKLFMTIYQYVLVISELFSIIWHTVDISLKKTYIYNTNLLIFNIYTHVVLTLSNILVRFL